MSRAASGSLQCIPATLLKDFIEPMEISRYRVAKNIHVPQRRIDLICRGEAAVSADMALRLGRLFGTTPEFWINLQAQLIALPGITVEDREEIEAALSHCRNGIDFADALHLAASKSCTELLTFDDRGYARRAKKLRLKPPVRAPNR